VSTIERALERESAAARSGKPRSTLGPAREAEADLTPQQLILRLQQSVGNAALLRQPSQPPAAEEELFPGLGSFVDFFKGFFRDIAVRRDVEVGRARVEAARRRHEERLAEIREREQPHVFRSAGVRTTTAVDDRTAGLLQASLAETLILKPYLKGKFPAATIPGKFKIHDSNDEFEYSYAKLHDIRDSPAAVRQRVADVRAFFHRPTKTIHLRPTANLGEALHEAIHKVSSPGFRTFFGGFLDEGVTQYFTDLVLEEQRLTPARVPLYEPQLGCAKRLVRFTNRDLVARAFFLAPTPLVGALRTRLQLDTRALGQLAWGGGLCDRLPK
jgi:hypothetical protein